MYRNPKNTKQEIKLWFFYLLDMGIVGGLMILASYILKIVPLSGGMQILFYILTAGFGIFLCAKTPNHPTDRNLTVIMQLLKMDRNNYYSIEYKNFE